MDYKNGKIYKILNTVNDECYIGSTCQKLSQRLAKHRSVMNSQNKKNRRLYDAMRVIGADSFYIELVVKEYPCKKVEQLRAVEGEYIRTMGILNHCIAGRDKQQWYEDNKEKVKEHIKQYRTENLDKIKQSVKAYTEKNKDPKSQYNREYYKNNKDKRKEYIENNKDILKQKRQEYYHKNIEKMTEKNRAKTVCSCGQEVLKRNLAKHQRTKKHQEALNNLNNSNNVSLQSDNIRTHGKTEEGEEI